MGVVAAGEEAATRDPGGPQGPVDVSWLILQRLSDITEQLGDLRRSQDQLRAEVKEQVAELRVEVREQVADLRRSQDQLRAEVKEQVAELRAEVREQVAELRRSQDELRAEAREQFAELRSEIAAVRTDLGAEIASLRNWSLGLLLLAILGLLAKLLIPGI